MGELVFVTMFNQNEKTNMLLLVTEVCFNQSRAMIASANLSAYQSVHIRDRVDIAK